MIAAFTWDDTKDWLGDEGIAIGLVVLGAFIATRIVTLLAKRRSRRLASVRASTTDTRAEIAGAHQQALVGAVRWALNFSIVFVAIVWVLFELSLPPSALVPLASVIGAGLGFGAQQIVGDVLTGFFILSERQFGVGDLIRVGPLMSVGWVEGRVEEMTLRVTKVRTFDGDLVTIANGELRQSVNASRDWARVLVTVPLSRDVDLDAVSARLNAVGERLAAEPAWGSLLLETPEVSGIDDLGAEIIQLRVVGRSLPGQQWKVARELRRRIVLALREIDVAMEEPPAPAAEVRPDAD
ncbi:MAG: mechanosensitive ion channel family protein [Ilumatobacteraceae bacterium]